MTKDTISFEAMIKREKADYDELVQKVEKAATGLKELHSAVILLLANAEIIPEYEKTQIRTDLRVAFIVASTIPSVISNRMEFIRKMTIQLIENTGDDLPKEQKVHDDFIVFLSDMDSRLETSLNGYTSDTSKLFQSSRNFYEVMEEILSKIRANRVLTTELIKIGHANRKSEVNEITTVILIFIVVALLLAALAFYYVVIK